MEACNNIICRVNRMRVAVMKPRSSICSLLFFPARFILFSSSLWNVDDLNVLMSAQDGIKQSKHTWQRNSIFNLDKLILYV